MKRKTVLIVEDDPQIRTLFGTALRHHGYATLEAADGAEGIRVATEHVPDLVLMNLSIPVVNGVDACEILKEHPRTGRVPVLVVSGHKAPAVQEMAWTAGCDDYLYKPIEMSTLVDEVRQRIGPAQEDPTAPVA